MRYIGKTGDIKQRFRGHIYEATHSDYSDSPCSHKNNWIRKIIDSGKMPIIEAIEEITYERCNEREKYWISYFGRDNLVNETDGEILIERFCFKRDIRYYKNTRTSQSY